MGVSSGETHETKMKHDLTVFPFEVRRLPVGVRGAMDGLMQSATTLDAVWALRGLLGGALIGLSASLLLAMNGRVAGISGMLQGLLGGEGEGERVWRGLFLAGLMLGGVIALVVLPGASLDGEPPAIGIAVLAGVLVGIGTHIGNGCTSGHGVCGISRFSVRSVVATVTFIATGAITVAVMRAMGMS